MPPVAGRQANGHRRRCVPLQPLPGAWGRWLAQACRRWWRQLTLAHCMFARILGCRRSHLLPPRPPATPATAPPACCSRLALQILQNVLA